ncbi:Uncharacterised protein [Halioglobus japonicus]|nr:Uncharacterised protein [Halioglobus japonicus]
MNTVQKIAVAYLLGMALLVLGFAVGEYKIFPYHYIAQLRDFIEWKPEAAKEMPTREKLLSQLGFADALFVYNAGIPGAIRKKTHTLTLPDANSTRDNPNMYIEPGQAAGYRAVFGAMDFNDSFWGGILIGPDAEVIHTWKLSTDHLPLSTKPDQGKNMYGLALLPDGSVIYTMGEDGGGIVRVDACSNIVWNLEGLYHHTVSMSEHNDYFWTWEGVHTATHPKVLKVDAATGEVLQTIDMEEVMLNNDAIHLFDIRQNARNQKDIFDVSHANDIDELTVAQAKDFPAFKPGDLLMSYRNLNLIFVIDPKTLQIKWWRVGATNRQHDSDWENGTITSFSNNMSGARKGHSDIVRIDPNSLHHEVIVDGKDLSMFSIINARQNLTDFNTRMITSSTQGWALELDNAGELVFTYINTYNAKRKTDLHLSETYRLKQDFFTNRFWEQCKP